MKGILFVDYVRMVKAHKDTAWEEHLEPGDLPFLSQRIDINAWYPMEVYERMGLAILSQIARGDLDLVKTWGRETIDELRIAFPDLFANADARETLMRFQVMRQSLFDFPAARFIAIHDGEARLELTYGMSEKAEEAATHQSMGFVERLLEVSGAQNPQVSLRKCSWKGDETTIVLVKWEKRAPAD